MFTTKITFASWVGLLLILSYSPSHAFSTPEKGRRAFLSKIGTASVGTIASSFVVSTSSPDVALAAPEILNTPSGVKYAVTKKPSDSGAYPQSGDIVAIEYTGYLTNGQIFDATHAEGKKNALLFKLGSTAVIPGLNDVVSNMRVGEKVQAIVPPQLAFGDVGVCIEDGECLIKPGSTLVYDVLLKKSSIPPP